MLEFSSGLLYFGEQIEQQTMRAVHFFRNKKNSKCFPFTSKAASGYFGQILWYWTNGTTLHFNISTLACTIEASRKLPAAAVKLPPVTCGNRRQSLPAEYFACIRRQISLQNNLPAAISGNFACAIFTLYSIKVTPIKSTIKHLGLIISSSVIHRCFIDDSSMFTRQNIVAFNVEKQLKRKWNIDETSQSHQC